MAGLEHIVNSIVALSGPNDTGQLLNTLKKDADTACQGNQAGLAAAIEGLDMQTHSLGVLFLL